MPICTNCSRPTSSLFTTFGKDHVILSPCSRHREGCGSFADPYLEHGIVIVILDLILVKPRAYRHLLFNRPNLGSPWNQTHDDDDQEPALSSSLSTWSRLVKRFISLLLVDSYIRWFYLCLHHPTLSAPASEPTTEHRFKLPSTITSLLTRGASESAVEKATSVTLSYLSVLSVTGLETLTFHFAVTLLTCLFIRFQKSFNNWKRKRRGRGKVKTRAVPTKSLSDPSRSISEQAKEEEEDEEEGENDDPLPKTALDLFRPHLPPTALLLSNLSTILLLSIVLLWDSNLGESQATTTTTRYSTDRLIRTFVGGLSSGVALGVLVPDRPEITTSILTLAWILQALVKRLFGFAHLPSGLVGEHSPRVDL
ncbi:Arv1-domain-containing protein [Violaceomyces palustris]|uniref:Arv1-domain-containing protein n=1 Tax=Violaceomyces palustris TaxID=1673888 RepID=A0ACD0NX75_9BASI|nr:Arv1-domain-containing protein [Violaceomyces palustris]